jgi:probable phosphoglycerate mutase
VITAYFDGGSRGNPGSAGYGVYIEDEEGTVLAELAEGIGVATNNVAEYHGLVAALQWAADRNLTELHVKGDSLLLIQQMLGKYRIKNEGLLPLYREARHLCARIGRVTFEHIPRERNKNADRLSNVGMDQNVR